MKGFNKLIFEKQKQKPGKQKKISMLSQKSEKKLINPKRALTRTKNSSRVLLSDIGKIVKKQKLSSKMRQEKFVKESRGSVTNISSSLLKSKNYRKIDGLTLNKLKKRLGSSIKIEKDRNNAKNIDSHKFNIYNKNQQKDYANEKDSNLYRKLGKRIMDSINKNESDYLINGRHNNVHSERGIKVKKALKNGSFVGSIQKETRRMKRNSFFGSKIEDKHDSLRVNKRNLKESVIVGSRFDTNPNITMLRLNNLFNSKNTPRDKTSKKNRFGLSVKTNKSEKHKQFRNSFLNSRRSYFKLNPLNFKTKNSVAENKLDARNPLKTESGRMADIKNFSIKKKSTASSKQLSLQDSISSMGKISSKAFKHDFIPTNSHSKKLTRSTISEIQIISAYNKKTYRSMSRQNRNRYTTGFIHYFDEDESPQSSFRSPFSVILNKKLAADTNFSAIDIVLGKKGIRNIDIKKLYTYINILYKEITFSRSIINSEESPLDRFSFITLPDRLEREIGTIVLDLDETLIHAEPRVQGKDYDHIVELTRGKLGVFIRPFLTEFLEHLSRRFELVLYTASGNVYADKMRMLIDPDERFFRSYLSRRDCVQFKNAHIKCINNFSNRETKEILIIDNALYAFPFNHEQKLLIRPFFGEKDDCELLKVLRFIKRFLLNKRDVKEIFENTFTCKEFLNCKTITELVELFKIYQ